MIDPNQVGEGTLTEEQLIYKENILDHYKHPRNKKQIDHPNAKHKELNPFCGDTIEVAVVIENGKIVDVGFQGRGCAISQASMSMLTEKLQGMTLDDVKKMSQTHIMEMLGIPIGVVRMKCAMLGLRTTQKSIEGK